MVNNMMPGAVNERFDAVHAQKTAIGQQRAIRKSPQHQPSVATITPYAYSTAMGQPLVTEGNMNSQMYANTLWNQWQTTQCIPNISTAFGMSPQSNNHHFCAPPGQSGWVQHHPTMPGLPPTISSPNTDRYQQQSLVDNTGWIGSHQITRSMPMDCSRPSLCADMSDRTTSLPDHISFSKTRPVTAPSKPDTEQQIGSSDDSDSDSDDLSHPNKFPVQIESHKSKLCNYQRQLNRSGEKIKQRTFNTYDSATGQPVASVQQIKYYQKDMARVCRCGNYPSMDGALTHGRSNDCDGYEIHYNQKCRWKAYDDYKTGKRVLIRLCKCYKPMI